VRTIMPRLLPGATILACVSLTLAWGTFLAWGISQLVDWRTLLTGIGIAAGCWVAYLFAGDLASVTVQPAEPAGTFDPDVVRWQAIQADYYAGRQVDLGDAA
jgi:hypothetical protein